MTYLADLYAAARSPSGRAFWDARIVDIPGGIPLRDTERPYYLSGLVTDVPSFEAATGFVAPAAASTDEALRFVIGREAPPTLEERRWWAEVLRSIVTEEDLDEDGTNPYGDELAGIASQLLTRQEAGALFDEAEIQFGATLSMEAFRVLKLRDDLPLVYCKVEDVPRGLLPQSSLWFRYAFRVYREKESKWKDWWLSSGQMDLPCGECTHPFFREQEETTG